MTDAGFSVTPGVVLTHAEALVLWRRLKGWLAAEREEAEQRAAEEHCDALPAPDGESLARMKRELHEGTLRMITEAAALKRADVEVDDDSSREVAAMFEHRHNGA